MRLSGWRLSRTPDRALSRAVFECATRYFKASRIISKAP